MDTDYIIQKKHYVVIRMHDEDATNIIQVDGSKKIARKYCSVEPLIGHPYGSVFEISNGKIVKLSGYQSLEEDFKDELAASKAEGATSAKNDWFIDDNTAQKLNMSDVDQMKKDGVDRVDIIKNLVANSQTWSSKTTFAQEKWLKRKAKKYLLRFRVERCTPETICNVYRFKSSAKICAMRTDSLARLLSHANIYAGCRCLVFESLLGLITSSVAYRMRGLGRIISAYAGEQPNLNIIQMFNFKKNETEIIQPCPANLIGPAADIVRTKGFTHTGPQETVGAYGADYMKFLEKRRVEFEKDKIEFESKNNNNDGSNGNDNNNNNYNAFITRERHSYFNNGRRMEDRPRVQRLLLDGFDSLIIASRYHPLPILKECIALLMPSASFAIYSEFVEPLNECYKYLHDYKIAIRMNIGDTWLREFQILPGRVHPQMNMVTSGGYVLTGIYLGRDAELKRIEKIKNDNAGSGLNNENPQFQLAKDSLKERQFETLSSSSSSSSCIKEGEKKEENEEEQSSKKQKRK